MKKFSEYQYLEGESMTDRDKKEAKSKFWGKGKWDNFILPLLPKKCEDMTFVDMGCNAGLFLGFAEGKGFNKVIGIDSDFEAVSKGSDYKSKMGNKYDLKCGNFLNADLPLIDYVVFINSHYYLNVSDFVFLLDKLKNRTRYCLIVSGNKKSQAHIASSIANDIRSYFRDWSEVEGIKQIDVTGDPSPRKLWTLAFQSPSLKRVLMNKLDCGNYVQSNFYQQLDDGLDYRKTKYYRIIRKYRLEKNPESLSVWTEDQLYWFMENKIRIYKSIKREGLEQPIIVDKTGKILDGNHRFMMLKHLGHKTILVREV